MDKFRELIHIMAVLRGPEGCPWDRQQTHETLKKYLLEETYETLEAIDSGDPARLCDELGDLLLQIVFHAQLAAEVGNFDIDGVCARIVAKLYHRHPHVFGEAEVENADQVVQNWEHLKRQEATGRERTSRLDGVPATLPALARAYDVQRKAAQVGFDWDDLTGPLEKITEEMNEFVEACRHGPAADRAAEVGDLLFTLVNVCRFLQIQPEEALRQTTHRFIRRFHRMEGLATSLQQDWADLSLAEMDELWERAKEEEIRKLGN
jgi:tetrapyrrole methylase family protein/MazG family protein